MPKNKTSKTNHVRSVAVNYDPFAQSAKQLDKVVPLSDAQKEIWASIEMDPAASCAFNESVSLEFRGVLDTTALTQSLQQLVKRHEALRAYFSRDGNHFFVGTDLELPVLYREETNEISLSSIVREETSQAFDLLTGPLLRAIIVKCGIDVHFLVLTIHHLVCDGWSLGIIISDLARFYTSITTARTLEIEPAYGFTEYLTLDLATSISKNDEEYWLRKFSEAIPEYEMPTDFPRPGQRTFNADRLDVEIDAMLVNQIKKTTGRLGCSLTTLMMAAYFVCLYKWTNEKYLVLGLPITAQPSISPGSLVGHCLNVVPIAIELDSQQTYEFVIKLVSDEILDSYEHQNCTFGTLLKKLPIQRDPSRIPLIPILFNVDKGLDESQMQFSDLKTHIYSNPRQYENFELFINAADYGDRFIIECQYNTDLFSNDSINQRITEYLHILAQITQTANRPLHALDLIPTERRQQILELGKGEDRDWDVSTLNQLIAPPDNILGKEIVVSSCGEDLSFAELERRSNQLAHFLIEEGVIPGSLVGICVQRSNALLVSLLGILKAGAAYVPLDPEYPLERLRYMVEDSGLNYLVTQSPLVEQLPKIARCYCVDQITDRLETQAHERPENLALPPDSPAYVIYTSGSTGKPKGVSVPHRAVVNFLNAMVERPGLTSEDCLLAITTLSFDIAVLELYLPLVVGAKVVIASSEESGDGQRLLALMKQQGVNTMQATPATWRLLIGAGWEGEPRLKVLCGGEALAPDLAAQLLARTGELWNMYGPTETTVWSACAAITDPTQPISLGEPIANTQLYVLDENRELVPQGIPGELVIGGDGVTLGYLNRDDLTQERYIENPFGSGKLYLTGDKVRYRLDGSIEYQGRLDQQVKVRGHRIELGEIESLMRQHPQIADCALSVREERAGDTRLVAFVVWEQEALTLTEVREYLLKQLPAYMIPQHIETLGELPQTLNGKLNRNALQKLSLGIRGDKDNQSVRQAFAPQTVTEVGLLPIWQSVLNVVSKSIDDNFFDLGGHSLLIAQLIQRIESEYSVRLQYRDIFAAPTLRELAALVEIFGKSRYPPIEINRETGNPALSLAQQRLWYLEQLIGISTAYNLPSAFRFIGPLNISALEESFKDLMSRQQALRTRLIEKDGTPRLEVLSLDDIFPAEFHLEQIDLSKTSDSNEDSALEKCLLSLQNQIIDFGKPPLFKSALLKLGQDSHVLFFMPHHIVFDGWSFDIFLKELTSRYQYHCGVSVPDLIDLPFQHTDYAHWLQLWVQSDEITPQIVHWQRQLSGQIPTLEMPLDFPRKEDNESTEGDQVLFDLDIELVNRLSQLALNQGCSFFMLMLTAYAVILNRYTRQDDIIIGAPVADRSRPGTDALIGMFVNSLVLRFKFNGKDNFVEFLNQVKEQCISAFSNQDVPFEKLLEIVEVNREIGRSPLFQTALTYQDITRREVSMADIRIEQVEIPAHNSLLDLSLWMKRKGPVVVCGLVYSTSLFEHSTIEQFADHFAILLNSICNNWHQPISHIEILDRPQRQQLIKLGKGEDRDWDVSTLNQLIAPPDNILGKEIVVSSCGEDLSFAELERRSNQLAHFLIEEGVIPGSLVGICVQRSNALLVSLLGILKAGAAYVPLDPEYPLERLRYMVEDSGLNYLVTQSPLVEQLPKIARCYCVDQITDRLETQAHERPENLALPPDSPAYVIYTSGSTGKPKGVSVPHRAVVNFLNAMVERPGLTSEDCLLAITTLSFDIAVLELYLPLVVGAKVVIASSEESGDGQRLLALMKQQGVNTMQATPATWRLLIGAGWEGEPRLKVLCGGEALAPDLAAQLLARTGELWNMYGPTETTVWSACAAITDPTQPISLGEPIANTQLYVLDENRELVPQGIPGELVIGGDGVTLGYLNRDDLTQERYIENPFGSGKLYLTGDKVRYRLDGSIEYQGRLDQQVKVRGHRIELGEIESLMRQHPQIADCALSVREERAGDTRLVAFVVWEQEALTLTEVREYLLKQLPAYMIPQHIETLGELPQTLNGKLNRNALQAFSLGVRRFKQKIELPKTDNEKWLGNIWQEACGIEQVCRQDNFFDLGGHSLLSMQVINTISKANRGEIRPRDMLLENLCTIAEKLLVSSKAADHLSGNEPPKKKGIKNLLRGFFFKR